MDRTGRLCSHLRGGMLPVFRILPSAKTHNKKMDAMLNGKKNILMSNVRNSNYLPT